jgi:uncharacterized surface protein with fasciclin (FAS1) repeats
MSISHAPRVLAAGLAIACALTLGACSSSDDSSSASDTPATTAASTTSTPAGRTIVDVASGNKDFSTLVSAVKAAGLAETLSGTGPFTLFAPTNEAFEKLPAGTVDSLLKPESKQKLAEILTYHAVVGEVMAADVTPGKVKTANGAEFTVAVADGNVTITDASGNTANVVQTDITADNGVIHVIDAVLMPSA